MWLRRYTNVSVFESNRDSFPIIIDLINDPNIMEEGNSTMKSIPNQMPKSLIFNLVASRVELMNYLIYFGSDIILYYDFFFKRKRIT